MGYCEFCKKEISYSKRRDHLYGCMARMEYDDNKDAEARQAEQEIIDARINILNPCHEFTEDQANNIIALVDHMLRENF